MYRYGRETLNHHEGPVSELFINEIQQNIRCGALFWLRNASRHI